MPRASRKGGTIIEVLIALIVLAVAGSGMIALVGQTLTGVDRLSERQNDMRRAASVMDAAATWSRVELELHVGSTRSGPFLLTVAELPNGLFAVDVRDTTGYVLLRTTFYRPESQFAGEGRS